MSVRASKEEQSAGVSRAGSGGGGRVRAPRAAVWGRTGAGERKGRERADGGMGTVA